MITARLTSICAMLALSAALSTGAGAQTANPFKKPAATQVPTTQAPATPAAPANTMKDAAEKKAPSEAQLASRARMKECGAEWQTMKKAGQTKGKTWREFSSGCLKKK